MTGWRQENKGWSGPSAVFAAFFAIMPLICGVAHAASTERVVSDRYTGLAIDGCDPVAYFTDRTAMQGSEAFEASWGGAIWRFHSARNKEVFLADPGIYGPQFGGYDPFDLARGKVVAGRPQLWLIFRQRLYLFRKPQNRDAFLQDPAKLARSAADNWPRLSATLSGY